MAEERQTNRRQEQRMPLEGLVLKVKQSGISHKLQAYVACRSVDISPNGLAFASDQLDLSVPEKIDFILSIENHEITGTGVTCNKRQNANETEYGLMFLAVTPELTSIFEQTQLSTSKLENLSKNQAEQFVHSLLHTNNSVDKFTLNKQQQLFDACRTYLIRLGEMGVRMPSANEAEKLLHPIQAVKIFRAPEHKILLRWHNAAINQQEQLTIAVQSNIRTSAYIINNKHHVQTVIQVLEILGQKIQQHISFI